MESKSSKTAWAALENAEFRKFWIAGVIMSSGQVIQDLCASWLMTSLTQAPLPVALLQTAASMPVLILAFPAGAVADLVDRRKWMITLLLGLSISSCVLAIVANKNLLTVNLLLGLILLSGCLSASFSPAWMRTVPDLLSGHQIPWGVTLNSTAVNIARLIGAAAAGLILGNFIPGFGFFVTSVGYLAPALVLFLWRREVAASEIPPEPLPSAISGGLRYALHSPPVQRVALRTFAFAICGSALLALLPSVARQVLKVTAAEFSLLWAAFGAGALLGATILIPIRARVSLDAFIAAMSAMLATSIWLISTQVNYWLCFGLLVVAGAGWVGMVSSFGVAMGSVSPRWVLSRMLSLYMICFQGAAAVGSIIWGLVAQWLGPGQALFWGGMLLGCTILLRWVAPMPESNPADLAPAREWPNAGGSVPHHDGPVLVSVEYSVDPEDTTGFLIEIHKLRLARIRDGAYQWFVFQCSDQQTHFMESFMLDSWAGHLRQHERVTISDMAHQKLVRQYHKGPEAPRVRHWLGVRG